MNTKILELEARIKTLEDNGIPGVRDFFATSALSILANDKVSSMTYSVGKTAEWAYEMADAMIKERNKTLDS